MRIRIQDYAFGITGSYGQVFFSTSPRLGFFLVAASFIQPQTGFCGFFAVLVALFMSRALGLNRDNLVNGTYSFNALLAGLALGSYYHFDIRLLVLIIFVSLLSLLFTVLIATFTDRHKLPFLSIPFTLCVWIVLLNENYFDQTFVVRYTAGLHSGVYRLFPETDALFAFPAPIGLYFRSMSALFFQQGVLPGMLISLGLILYSRISFLLSLLGFAGGYLFYEVLLGTVPAEHFTLISYNFILTAIGLGGFYFIASGASFLLAFVSTLITGILAGAFQTLLSPFAFPVYSLPFSLCLLMVLALLNSRYTMHYLFPVVYQNYNPELNLYALTTFMARFRNVKDVAIHLPFYGEWSVSQSHDGDQTHQQNYRYALDFVVRDEHQRSFKLPGDKLSDYYCYGLPVLAPSDGLVVSIQDGIEDNDVGDVNLNQNWGNSLVIKHSDKLYSKISHLKKGSFLVKEGDMVRNGDVVAMCGNSGRSPEPHIHFQLQASDKIGDAALNYPISYFISRKGEEQTLRYYEVPAENESVMRPHASPELKKALHFIPGMQLEFEVNDGKKDYTELWEVFTDIYNNSFIQCQRTGARAYFSSNELLFYFTAYKGSKKCLLYYFFLGAYKVLLSKQSALRISDRLPVENTTSGLLKLIQDFAAPFWLFLKPVYHSGLSTIQDVEGIKFRLDSQVHSNISIKIELSITGLLSIQADSEKWHIRARHISR
ncbi:MAG TPA: urea transporter [Bacteroidia bacterium]|nr:urea transporter [Bacteroidia bacterium]